MPTAAKLAGAVIFALFGWYIAGLATPFFPEGVTPRYWIPATAISAFIIGWRLTGARAGRGYYAGIANGLTTAAVLAFCWLFILGFNMMIKKTFRMIYNGAIEAIQGIFIEMIDYALLLGQGPVIINLVVGAIICAWVVEFFAQRFP